MKNVIIYIFALYTIYYENRFKILEFYFIILLFINIYIFLLLPNVL